MILCYDYDYSLCFIIILLLINCYVIAYSYHQVYILCNFISITLLIFTSLIIFDIYLISFFIAIVYSGAIIAVLLIIVMILDKAEIHINENYNINPLLTIVTQAILFSYLLPLIYSNELTLDNNINKLAIDNSYIIYITLTYKYLNEPT